MSESSHDSCVRRPDSREYYFQEGCFILELWNSPEDDAVSVVRARVPAGKTTRLHRLKGVFERHLILEGQGMVQVEGREPRRVGPGDVVLVPRGASQRIANTGPADLVFLAVCTPRFTPGAYEDLEPGMP